jgi:hypothetical protein
MAPVTGLCMDGLTLARDAGAFAGRFWDELVGQQLDGVALHVDAGVKQMRLLGESHGLHDLVAGQAQLAQEYMERAAEALRATSLLVAIVQTGLEALVKTPLWKTAGSATAVEAAAKQAPASVR